MATALWLKRHSLPESAQCKVLLAVENPPGLLCALNHLKVLLPRCWLGKRARARARAAPGYKYFSPRFEASFSDSVADDSELCDIPS